MEISVVLPAHDPDPATLRRALRALRAQSLPPARWETILVDNASPSPLAPADGPGNLRVVAEPALGLTAARRRGFASARAPLVVLVDDDNALAPDYLEEALRLAAAHPGVGAFGGKIRPVFARTPAPWQREFFLLLALRDLGDQPLVSADLPPNAYPDFAPVGAGMVVRPAALTAWRQAPAPLSDRRGRELTSGGDNELVFAVLRAGRAVAYFPSLVLDHLIPPSRLETNYLARLNRGIQASWMRVLTRHDANPWPPVSRATVPLRQARAWFTHRAWAGPAEFIRWQGACGHFEGRAP